MRPERAQGQHREEEEVRGDGGPPDRPQELRPPEGQAFLRHRQVRVDLRLTKAVPTGGR